MATIRTRAVDVDLLAVNAQPGQTLQLNFFDDAAAALKVEQCETFGTDRLTMTGSLAGDDDGRFVLSRVDDAVVATVWTGDGRVFQLRPARGGSHVAEELDVGALPECECHSLPVVVNGPHEAEIVGDEPGAGECVGPVDVLIVFTEAARNLVGNDTAIRALAYGAIASANIAYANSGISVRLRLAAVLQVDYEETDSFSTDLTRLSIGGDGYLDEVQPMRNLVHADMVCMFVASPVSCGIAFVMGVPSPGFEASAYSVVQVGCAIPALSFAHELGHNFGCQHLNGDGSNGAFSYSFGHQFVGLSGRPWRTVMASGSGQRVPQFSNPLVLFDGVPTGIAEGLPGEADNARTIDNTAALVASFRNATPPDCNGNGVSDSCEIADGTSADFNDNGLPDECELPDCETVHTELVVADDAHSFDTFGTSVAITPNGSRMAIGAELHDEEGTSGGAAYIFRRERGQWVQEARLFGTDTNPFDRFGHAVAISAAGDVVVVTAYRHAVFWPDAGAGYIFVRNGTQWTQQAMLSADDAAMTDLLGFSAAISADGSRVALGALWDDDGGDQSGSVYVFDRVGDNWQQTTKIVANDATPGSEFGFAVAMTGDGTRLLIGARFDDRFNTNFGAAYVFRDASGDWVQEAKLTANNPQSNDRFGGAVTIDDQGLAAVIGTRGDDEIAPNAGAAQVFDRQGTSWIGPTKLTPRSAGGFKAFGSAAAISPDGSRLVVGSASDYTRLPLTMGGSATCFVRRADQWFEIRRLTELDSASNDAAGSAVAISNSSDRGALAAIAWPLDDVAGMVDSGSIRVFSLDALPADCNHNEIDDPCDIALGNSADQNRNGVPDDCERTNELNATSVQAALGDQATLLTVIANWGACAHDETRCAGDVDHSGAVDLGDLLDAISAWKPTR